MKSPFLNFLLVQVAPYYAIAKENIKNAETIHIQLHFAYKKPPPQISPGEGFTNVNFLRNNPYLIYDLRKVQNQAPNDLQRKISDKPSF